MTLKNSSIAGGLVKAINNVENPKKTEATDQWGNSFSYAPLDEVVKVIKNALADQGMAVLQPPAKVMYEILPNGFEQGVATVTTQIIHESGEVLEFDPITFKANGNTPQMVGSAITYGRRYSLMSIFGIAGEDDDDGRVASLHGVNTGSSKSVPENPNKDNEEKSNQTESQDNQNAVELINEEQRQELLDIATEVANLRKVSVESLVGAFGGLDNLEVSKFESTKKKISVWLEKARAEIAKAEQEKASDEVDEKEQVETSKEESKSKNDDSTSENQSTKKGSAVFTITDIQSRETNEGTKYVEIQVEKTKTPLYARPEIAKNLEVGMSFLGYYSQKGTKVTLERVEDVQTSLV